RTLMPRDSSRRRSRSSASDNQNSRPPTQGQSGVAAPTAVSGFRVHDLVRHPSRLWALEVTGVSAGLVQCEQLDKPGRPWRGEVPRKDPGRWDKSTPPAAFARAKEYEGLLANDPYYEFDGIHLGDGKRLPLRKRDFKVISGTKPLVCPRA